MKKGFFITGTDTGVGKTFVARQILQQFNSQGLRTAAIKPVASGCEETTDGLRNEDALLLQQSMSMQFTYKQINPFAFKPPIAPHIAAQQVGVTLNVEKLLDACQPILTSDADVVIVEGAGGWLVPLNDHETLADFAIALGFPIILVVGMKLGCLNHAFLTATNIQQRKVKFSGWIANSIVPNMLQKNENLNTLKNKINAPLLFQFEYKTCKLVT